MQPPTAAPEMAHRVSRRLSRSRVPLRTDEQSPGGTYSMNNEHQRSRLQFDVKLI